jgi:hypothetical protein
MAVNVSDLRSRTRSPKIPSFYHAVMDYRKTNKVGPLRMESFFALISRSTGKAFGRSAAAVIAPATRNGPVSLSGLITRYYLVKGPFMIKKRTFLT